MGIHEPYCDRRADRNGLCARCAETEKLLIFHDSDSDDDTTVTSSADTPTVHFQGPHVAINEEGNTSCHA
jgi:hypothetical protein